MSVRWHLVSLSCLLLCGSCGITEKNKINKNSAEQSREKEPLVAQIKKIQQEITAALKEKDFATYGEKKLTINYLNELQRLPADAQGEERAMLVSKYEVLRQILADELLSSLHSFSEKSPEKESATSKLTVMKIEKKDVPYDGPDFTSVYHPLVLDEVNKVFRDFGDLYVSASLDPKLEPVPQELRVKKPWSGYWYPFGDDILYREQDAPLAKYERMLRAMGYEAKITESERQRYAGFKPDSWEGLCDAWSLAAINAPEPSAGRTIHGEYFSIADQKALLTFAHLRYSKKMYGMSYRGDAESDGTYQDLKPEAFHKLILHFLGVEKRAFIIDDMAGVQVWNKPLYRYRWILWQDPDHDYAYLVRGYPWLVKERQKETDELTKTKDAVAPIYNYRLYVDKNFKKQGGYRVVAGQWLGESYVNHPDSATIPEVKGSIGSHNPEFNKYIEIFSKEFMTPAASQH